MDKLVRQQEEKVHESKTAHSVACRALSRHRDESDVATGEGADDIKMETEKLNKNIDAAEKTLEARLDDYRRSRRSWIATMIQALNDAQACEEGRMANSNSTIDLLQRLK